MGSLSGPRPRSASRDCAPSWEGTCSVGEDGLKCQLKSASKALHNVHEWKKRETSLTNQAASAGKSRSPECTRRFNLCTRWKKENSELKRFFLFFFLIIDKIKDQNSNFTPKLNFLVKNTGTL